ncbi:hypothetical protein B9Z55_025775 [Caenorhabditis nigoni]|uniref:Uncharacterized protein n=1 Tax=Caenorhabditis nigoni TaxID=1611254 RepID=A0A2G5T0K4_9PELO|nr:hypothetical protein B9Z55_025775 [Caenorhabditis nigoni]
MSHWCNHHHHHVLVIPPDPSNYLTTMGELEVPERELEYFATSARAGRRNALPEIEVEINDQDAAKLAERMSDMTAHCEETADNQNQPGPSQPKQGNS